MQSVTGLFNIYRNMSLTFKFKNETTIIFVHVCATKVWKFWLLNFLSSKLFPLEVLNKYLYPLGILTVLFICGLFMHVCTAYFGFCDFVVSKI